MCACSWPSAFHLCAKIYGSYMSFLNSLATVRESFFDFSILLPFLCPLEVFVFWSSVSFSFYEEFLILYQITNLH